MNPTMKRATGLLRHLPAPCAPAPLPYNPSTVASRRESPHERFNILLTPSIRSRGAPAGTSTKSGLTGGTFVGMSIADRVTFQLEVLRAMTRLTRDETSGAMFTASLKDLELSVVCRFSEKTETRQPTNGYVPSARVLTRRFGAASS